MRIAFASIPPLAALIALAACRTAGAPPGGARALTPVHAIADETTRVPVGPVYWVVDGRRLGVDSTGAIAASMQRLDPQTIRKVEVLKGRTAIERYGAQASGGVVIVTTRAAQPSGE